MLFHDALESDAATALAEARRTLQRAIELAPATARFHAMLGHTLDWDDDTVDAAREHLCEAYRLAQDDPLYGVYALTLRAESLPDDTLLADVASLARQARVDLEATRRELRATGFPEDALTLLRNAFLHPRNYFAALHRDEVLRLEAETGARAFC
ncbi:MAG: hypothetical protein K0S46_1256 [Moraxellaceae bacterium]|nr:hypothetical protein [Moraxellaceae bacterium]